MYSKIIKILFLPIILLGAFVMSYNGYTDVFKIKEIRNVSIDSIDFAYATKNRYVNINNGFTTNEFIPEIISNKIADNVLLYVYFPLINKNEFEKFKITQYSNEKYSTNLIQKIKTNVIIRRDGSNLNKKCLDYKNCIEDIFISQKEDNGISIKGLTEIGTAAFPISIRKVFEENGYILPENVVVLEENYTPSTPFWGWIKFIAGGIFILLIILSYLPNKKRN
jgi:hypothetical protein